MIKKLSFILFICIMTVTSCTKTQKCESDNPLLCNFSTPFEVPPFDKILNKHFKPAIEEGIALQNEEIEKIANSSEKPTFQNTIEALEYSGQILNRATTIFYNLNSANTNDSIQAIAKEVAPLLSKHNDDIMFNVNLFNRVKAVHDDPSSEKLAQEQKKLLEETYKDFVRSGAALDTASQNKLRKINSELSLLTLKFGENVLAETNSFKLILNDSGQLAGLPKGIRDAAAEDASKAGQEGKWLFSLQNPSVMPFLQYSAKRDLRGKIWNAYMMRGNNNNKNDNKKVIKDIIELRIQKAQLLGYDSWAAYILDKNMAKNPENVYNLLNQLWTPAQERAKSELADMQKMVNDEGNKFAIAPWDWRYYAEKVRKAKYDLDEEQLRPYFKLENVVNNGIFYVANRLYGLQFTEITDIPKYHPDVMAYEVKNADGSHLAVLYIDFFPRDSKRGGAWMTSYQKQYRENGKNISPVISLVCNFTKPSAESPSLLTFDEVQTIFHEFGHALHGMLSNCTYKSLSGTAVPRDFVELPSQIDENWASQPEVLKVYAKHYQTGEPMPNELISKIENSSYFNQGFATVEYLAASFLDMDFHTLKDTAGLNVLTFEKQSLDKLQLMPEIISRYRSTYFSHIFSGGYSSGYYSYVWAEILDADAFEAFRENGIFNPQVARAFRQNILERGGTEDPMVLYKRFRGAEPQITPLLKRRGLL